MVLTVPRLGRRPRPRHRWAGPDRDPPDPARAAWALVDCSWRSCRPVFVVVGAKRDSG